MTRNYLNGIYQDTLVSLGFTPKEGEEITCRHTVRGGDSDLELLREQVSGMVAARLLEQVKRGEAFAWGPMAWFTQDGLVIQAKKLFGEGESRLVPYGPWLQVSIDAGTCSLVIGNGEKTAMSMPCSAYNFYPGLRVLEALSNERSKTRAEV